MKLIIRPIRAYEIPAVTAHSAADMNEQDVADGFDHGLDTPPQPPRWHALLPSARECEIITVPNRTDRHIQRGGQL